MVFLDYTTVTIGSSQGRTLKYTTPNYKCLISLEIVSIERINKVYVMYAEVEPGSPDRLDYFLSSQTTSFGLTKVLSANTRIFSDFDLSPFTGIFHIFRLPESP